MGRAKKVEGASVINGVNIEEFKRQKALMEQGAMAVLSEKVEVIRNTLSEMQSIVDTTGVGINISGLVSDIEESRQSLDPSTDWNSSSAYC